MNFEDIVDDKFSGVVSVRNKQKIVFQKCYEYADIANKRCNTVDTKFGTASAGKVFVAVGILQLIEAGKLNFDSTIGSILKFDLKGIDNTITIRQLLTHTSGIPDYFDESVLDNYDELWTDYPNYKIRKSMDMIPLFINKPMMYKPGERFQYNNTGFVVLGLIIEEIRGELFDEYLKRNVFEPCEMTDTGYYELDRLPNNCANAYIYDKQRKEYYTHIYSIDVKGTGAGGAFTTVGNIESFWDNLLGGKLLSNKMLNEMMTLQAESNNEYYGYGIWLRKIDSEERYEPWFTGGDPGVSLISSYDRAEGVNITIISNGENNVWKIEKEIRGKIT
jgi:CubicO group peptidase (beta-lactamase class C family)